MSIKARIGPLYRKVAREQDAWAEKLITSGIPQTKMCDKCGDTRRSLIMDATIVASHHYNALTPRYDPCHVCNPFGCYRARMANAGIPSMPGLPKDHRTKQEIKDKVPMEIKWAPPPWAKRRKLWRMNLLTDTLDAWIISFPSSRYIEMRYLEDFPDGGDLLNAVSFEPYLCVDVNGIRGEGLAEFLVKRERCQSAQYTWIVGGDEAHRQLIPDSYN